MPKTEKKNGASKRASPATAGLAPVARFAVQTSALADHVAKYRNKAIAFKHGVPEAFEEVIAAIGKAHKAIQKMPQDFEPETGFQRRVFVAGQTITLKERHGENYTGVTKPGDKLTVTAVNGDFLACKDAKGATLMLPRQHVESVA